MAGLESPDKGVVKIEGRPVADLKASERAAMIGYVIQEGGLFPHLTCAANALLPTRFAGGAPGPEAARERLAELAELVRLSDDQLARYPSEVSGGQRQRVALVRALILDPPVLLLDEPLGALDPVIRASLQVELRRLFQTFSKSVVLVTHDLAEAAYLADRIVLLNEGKIVQEGSPQELIKSPANDFVRTFVGDQVERVRGLLTGGGA